MNEKNDHLVNICLENGIFLSSTWLKELYSFLHMATMNKKPMIYFTVEHKRVRILEKDIKAIRGYESEADHFSIESKVELRGKL